MSDRDRLQWGPGDEPRVSHEELEAELGSVVARGQRRRARRTVALGGVLAVLFLQLATVVLGDPRGRPSGVTAADDPTTTTVVTTPETAVVPDITSPPSVPQHPRPPFVVVARAATARANPDGEDFNTEIAVLNGTSGKAIRTIHRTVFNISELSLSRDGTYVYFVEWDCGTSSVMRVRVDGPADQKPETITEEESNHPSVSPDGRLLAYSALGFCDGDPVWELRVRNLATGQEHAVATEPEGWSMSSPTWSEDGTRVAVALQRGTYDETKNVHRLEEAFVAMLDPTRKQDPLKAPRIGSPRPGFGFESPAYLPDGSLFVVESELGERDGTVAASMLVVDAGSGRTLRRVATGDPTRSYGNTASDASGNHLLYLSSKGDTSELRVSDNGGRTVVLATNVTAADW